MGRSSNVVGCLGSDGHERSLGVDGSLHIKP